MKAPTRWTPPDEPLKKMYDDLLKVIINSLPVLVSYIDREGRYRFVNQYYNNWFGHNPSDLIGAKVSDVIGPGYSVH